MKGRIRANKRQMLRNARSVFFQGYRSLGK
jgi:hypothetical protein